MPQPIKVYYPSGRQLALPMWKLIGPQKIGEDIAVVVMVDQGKGDEQNPLMILDPRVIVVDEDTGEWLYSPRLQNLPGEMGRWMKENQGWGWSVPEAKP